jgi:hypothetical protein
MAKRFGARAGLLQMPDLEPLKALIAKYESKGDYNIVYGGIPESYRPEQHLGKSLTQCTVGEVLGWQAYVTSNQVGAVSSAAGKWQIIRKTLVEFGPIAGLSCSDLFNPTNQDRIFEVLLERRGYREFLSGSLSVEAFANNIAQEWAAMPVVSDIKGAHRKLKRGECFYAGDKVNKALVAPEVFLEAITAILAD